MSFRLRVLLLVVLVAVSATAATAWVILRQATHQVSESTTADRTQLDLVKGQLLDYARRHGTWEEVAGLVGQLARRTGQRIHLVSDSGVVIVDTDTQEGRTARALGSARAFVDPRPQLSLSGEPAVATLHTVKAILQYREEVRFAACLTRRGIGIAMSTDDSGVPRYTAETVDANNDQVAAQCRHPVSAAETESAATDVGVCSQQAAPFAPAAVPTSDGAPAPRSTAVDGPQFDCLNRVFTDEISDVAPVPVLVYLGARNDPAVVLSSRPLIAAAAGVALVVIAGTVLLSSRVLRPIGVMTAAAHRLGSGDLTSTVGVRGHDELAELGRSFNRMAESLRRGEERQRQLIADIAHELRTPLANLRGYLEALADGVITPDAQLFASLHEEAILQQRIVDDLQELALAEAGHLAYHRVPVDLAELLETCRTAHQALATASGVSLTVHLSDPAPAQGGRSPAGPLLVDADPDRLRQALGNLITNAVRATPPGGGVALHAERSGEAAVIRVVDTGSGIDDAALAHVFDRFWRADPARGRHTGGAGLGLAICRQIVTDHGGALTVTSTVDEGSTFTITLPLDDGPG